MTTPAFSPDLPELRVMAQLAGIPPARMADAFNDAEQLFRHITLDEVNRLREAFVRCATLGQQLATACDIYVAHAKGVLGTSA